MNCTFADREVVSSGLGQVDGSSFSRSAEIGSGQATTFPKAGRVFFALIDLKQCGHPAKRRPPDRWINFRPNQSIPADWVPTLTDDGADGTFAHCAANPLTWPKSENNAIIRKYLKGVYQRLVFLHISNQGQKILTAVSANPKRKTQHDL